MEGLGPGGGLASSRGPRPCWVGRELSRCPGGEGLQLRLEAQDDALEEVASHVGTLRCVPELSLQVEVGLLAEESSR